MARQRLLNPKPLHDEDIISMSIPARFAWAYLPCFADREGRLEDKPLTLKIEIFPNDSIDMNDLLNELESHKCILRYTINNRKYIQIRSFLRYQTPYHKEPESRIPPPEGYVPEVNHVGVKPTNPRDVPLPARSLYPDPVTISRSSDSNKNENNNSKIPENLTPSDYPPFDQNSFQIALGVWETAGEWEAAGPEPVDKARKAFNIEIHEDNWPEFIRAVDWAVTASKGKERKWLGRFYTFIEQHKWKDVMPPKTNPTLTRNHNQE